MNPEKTPAPPSLPEEGALSPTRRGWGPDAGEVLGLDNVRLDLPLAGAGSRVLAGFLDYVILGVLMAVWTIAFIAGMVGLDLQNGWLFAVLLLGLFLLNWGYFAGFEIALAGRTPGKAAVGLCVVTRAGGRPGAAALIIRNLVRVVDLLIGVPLMAVDPLARRLGDRLAGTLVVHNRSQAEPELILARLPAGWGAREGSVLEAFLTRASQLEPGRARRLALRFLAWIEREDPAFIAGVPDGPEGLDPLDRLKQALIEIPREA